MLPVLWWALVGAVAAFGVAALLSIGVFVLPVALLLGAVGWWSRRLRSGLLPGLLVGASLVPFWLAVQNLAGPGEVCESTPTVLDLHRALQPVALPARRPRPPRGGPLGAAAGDAHRTLDSHRPRGRPEGGLTPGPT